MFHLAEIKKNPIHFERSVDIKDLLLKRDQTIIDISNVLAKGQISYEDNLYVLSYDLDYQIVLPSSRSMEPVSLKKQVLVSEVFAEKEDLSAFDEAIDSELILPLESDTISLEESVIDNILLNIPLKVLTPDEQETDDLPSGDNWVVLTEDQYEDIKAKEKEKNNPFSALDGLFDKE